MRITNWFRKLFKYEKYRNGWVKRDEKWEAIEGLILSTFLQSDRQELIHTTQYGRIKITKI